MEILVISADHMASKITISVASNIKPTYNRYQNSSDPLQGFARSRSHSHYCQFASSQHSQGTRVLGGNPAGQDPTLKYKVIMPW